MAEALPRNARLRSEGTRNLAAAALASGVRRFIAQSPLGLLLGAIGRTLCLRLRFACLLPHGAVFLLGRLRKSRDRAARDVRARTGTCVPSWIYVLMEKIVNALRTIALIALLAFASLSLSQVPGSADSPTSPGARDGSAPSHGAIKGGSILPGETGGMPEAGAIPNTRSDRAISRCNDLSGTLREQCLLQEQGASTGGTRVPDPDVAKPAPTREAPPPQNPR